jgi:hypothetical protein
MSKHRLNEAEVTLCICKNAGVAHDPRWFPCDPVQPTR